MLILPPGHAESVRTPRSWSKRERWILGSVLAAVGALAIVVVIALVANSGHATGGSCIDVNIPDFTGASDIYQCGAPARALCESVGAPKGLNGTAGQLVAAECRKVHFPVGP